MQAAKASTTRRALFAALPAAALAAVPLSAAAAVVADIPSKPDMSRRWQSFIDGLDFAHPNGREVARQAYEAGFKLDDLALIMLSGEQSRDRYPVLFFNAHNGGYHSSSPRGVLFCERVRPQCPVINSGEPF